MTVYKSQIYFTNLVTIKHLYLPRTNAPLKLDAYVPFKQVDENKREGAKSFGDSCQQNPCLSRPLSGYFY